MLAIYAAQGKIRYQGQGVVSPSLIAEQWPEHLAKPEQPKGSESGKRKKKKVPRLLT